MFFAVTQAVTHCVSTLTQAVTHCVFYGKVLKHLAPRHSRTLLRSMVSCAVCSRAPPLQICAGCQETHCCGRVCQKRHWKLHKTICTLRGAPPAPAYAFHKSISSRLATGEILQILGGDCLETISAALLEHASAEDKPHVEESAIGADAILEDDSSADGIRPRHIRA